MKRSRRDLLWIRPMQIGCLRIHFYLHGVFSLKEKRNIANSIKQKIRNKFNVSVAEVESQGSLSNLILGITTVANDAKLVQQVLQKVVNHIERITSEEILDVEMEIFGC